MKARIGCAVIGFGGMGHWHAQRIAKHGDLQWVGAYDLRPERLAELPGTPGGQAFASREALLADPRVELVVVATPNDVHREIVIAALQAGKHVICEKPVAMDGAELEAMIAAAQRAGRLFTVHQNRRWDGDYLRMKRILDAHTLGPVFDIESRVHGSRGIPGDWRNQKAHGGGMVLDWGIHILDQSLMMTLPRKVVAVQAQLTHVTNNDCDDGFRAILTFDDGLTFLAEVGTSNFIVLPRWYMLGENGSAVIHDWSCKGEIVMVSDWENRDAVPIQAGAGLTKTMAPRTDETIQKFPLPEVQADWGEYYTNVVAAIRGEAAPLVTHDQQRRLMRLVEAVFDAGTRHEVVKLSL